MIALDESATTIGLWLAVVGSGLYHGLNPGMGWPLAVSAGLMDRNGTAFARALAALSLGHFAAMLAVLLPFAAIAFLADWQREIRIAAALLVIGFGVYRLIDRRHPRALARIPPTQLGLWSFAVAIAHGAGLMLVPIYLGLCSVTAVSGSSSIEMAGWVALAHSAAMLGAGGLIAFIVYRTLGLSAIAKTWFNLDVVWALSLIGVGAISLAATVLSNH